MKLYKDASERIDVMLDLKKLVKNIRTMKTLLKHSFMTPEIKKKIQNIENHVIDLEPDESERDFESSSDLGSSPIKDSNIN